jgi:hypothetical protein
MHATSQAQARANTTVGISGALVGFGVLTFALFPFALPFAILLGVSAAPLLPLLVLGAIPAAIVGLVRRVR